MKPRVYVETSVLSYLTALPSRDVVRAAHRHVTIEWWARRASFDLYISEAIKAAHVAIAAVHGAHFLLTWNCTHIANAVMRPKIEEVCRGMGLVRPVICTPEELFLQEGP